MTRRKTQEEFIAELKERNPNKINVVGEYVNYGHKIKVEFLNCGHTRYMTPSKLLQGQGCGHPNCLNKTISKNKINKRRKTIHKEFKDKGYKLLSEFNGVKEMVEVLNNNCGHMYKANAGNILNGSGCPICHGIKDDKLFKEEIKTKYGNEYTILGEYKNGLTGIKTRHNQCGHIWKPTPKTLLRERICPNCNKSKGEYYIQNFLEKHNIKYKREYMFDDCRNINPLPFDFAIKTDNKLKLIEFDGSQHFGESNYWGNKRTFKDIQRNDKIKNNYCKENNIPLLRIPYWWLRNDRAKRELLEFIT